MMSDEEAFQGMREELDRRPSEFETLRARVKELEAELAEMTALSATNLRHRREAEAERDEAIRERNTLKGLTSPTYEALLQKLVSAEATIEKVRTWATCKWKDEMYGMAQDDCADLLPTDTTEREETSE